MVLLFVYVLQDLLRNHLDVYYLLFQAMEDKRSDSVKLFRIVHLCNSS